MARCINAGVWFYLLVSDVLNPVYRDGNFWDEKLRQALSINPDIFNAPRMAGNAVAFLLLCFAVDLLLRWLWSPKQPSHGE
jgi:hypothetical protein